MILILSIKNDPCTEDVLSWLKFFKSNFVRINPEDLIILERFQISNDTDSIVLRVNNKKIDLSKIRAFWYRRGDLTLFEIFNSYQDSHLTHYLQKELEVLRDYIYKKLENKFHINKRSDNEVNKLNSLAVAKSSGLSIPPSAVIYNTNDSKFNYNKSFITKAFRNGEFKIQNSLAVGAPTELITKKITSSFPSFVQQAIQKKFELRVFYLLGEMYSTAIFSQQSEKTKIDFRNYDKEKPNRVVPFNLPYELSVKIRKFMKKSDLTCGSLDFIYSHDGNFYFLEVNPIGQFQQVSIPGNYYLDKVIAEKLIDHA